MSQVNFDSVIMFGCPLPENLKQKNPFLLLRKTTGVFSVTPLGTPLGTAVFKAVVNPAERPRDECILHRQIYSLTISSYF